MDICALYLHVATLLVLAYSEPILTVDSNDARITVDTSYNVNFIISEPVTYDVRLRLNSTTSLKSLSYVDLNNGSLSATTRVVGKDVTNDALLEVYECVFLDTNETCNINLKRAFVRISVVESRFLDVLVWLIGWMYFFAWSISFYPQMYLNYKRKSVVGLNFDFLSLNLVGFTAYALFNLLHYFNNTVQEEYMTAHPRSPLPVLTNDVVFAVHALIACAFTAVQCFIYERADQRISRTCTVWSSILLVVGFLAASLALIRAINLLQFVDSLSFIKMAITCSKYFPQAFFNFHRKSTVGWSIGNILLDFTGGSLAIMQMVLQSANVKDWTVFYGNPVKFGLGLVSIVFDVLFMFQHYVLYRKDEEDNEYEGIASPDVSFVSDGAVDNSALEPDV